MKTKWVKILGIAVVAIALAATAPLIAPVARSEEVPPLVLAYSIATPLLLLPLHQKEHLYRVERAHGRKKRRGTFDLSKIVDVLLVIVLMPTLINLIGALMGTSFGALQPLS